MGAEEDLPLYKAGEMLWKVFSPVFLVFGIFGNTLTIIVLTNKRSRNSSTSLFLAALALSDLIALLAGLVRQWVKYTFNFDVRFDVSPFGCKLHWFVVYVITQYSSWMLVCVTLERVISTWMPHFRVVLCRVRIAIIAIVTIFVILFALNLHFFYGYGDIEITRDNETVIEKCVPLTPAYESFFLYEWAWIDLCVFFLIPVTVLLVGNSAIIYKVMQSRRKSHREVVPATINDPSVSVSAAQVPKNGIRDQNKNSKKISSLTTTLILVSSVFIVCITPIVVFPIGFPYWSDGADDETLAELFFWDCVSSLIMYINNTVNFLLYFMSGTKFRNEVKILFCGKRFIGREQMLSGTVIQQQTIG